MIKQNIVFVENKAGSLNKVTKMLKENDVFIYGFACFDAPEFALFRMVADNAEKAEKVLTENGYMNRINNVIAIDFSDEVGGLDALLEVFAESNINLDYVYTSFHRTSQIPVVILQSEELTVSESILRKKGYRIIDNANDFLK